MKNRRKRRGIPRSMFMLATLHVKIVWLLSFEPKQNLNQHKMETSLIQRHNGIAPNDSELSLPTQSEVNIAQTDPLASSQITWTTRYKCFQAYICFVMSYLSTLRVCERVGNYKVTIFIPYLVCNVCIGVPAVFVEIMLGRFVMGNVSQAWNMCPLSRGVFWCLCVVTFFAINLNYLYNVYLIKYFFASFYEKWDKCEGQWSKVNCYVLGQKSAAIVKCMLNHSSEFCYNLNWETSGSQYFRYEIQSKTDAMEVGLSFLFLAATVIAISAITYKGIQSLEKMLGLLVYPSVILWSVLVLVSFSAPNALSGFKKLFHFNLTEFTRPQMWVEGFEDMFYLLGLGRLSLSFISSHGKITDNILIDVVIVIFGSVTSCLLITTPILSVIAVTKGMDGSSTSRPFFKGVTDVFVSMSEALLFYPKPVSLWTALYYLDCFIISLSSQAVLVLAFCEAMEGVIGSKKEKTYFWIIIAISFISYITASAFQYIEVVQEIDHATVILTTVMLCTFTWQLFYGIRKFNYDYYFMTGCPIPTFLKFSWMTLLIMPFVGTVLKMYYRIPKRPIRDVVFIYFGIAVFIYFLLMLIMMIKFHVKKEGISNVFLANPNWGPENALLRKSRLLFDTSQVTREFMYRQELYKKPFIKPPDFSDQNIVHQI